MLQSQQQISLSIFQLFIFFTLLQIMTNHINLKISLKKIEETRHQKHWHDIIDSEIEAFIDILFYMKCTILSRIRKYWNININHVMQNMIINFMSRTRWEQIKRYLKIFNLLDDQKIDTRDIDWWKKLESLTFEFRKISKTYWLSENHVSVDEQLMKFKERSRHIMQIISKATEIKFKLYNLCQQNYLYDFLFISKIWNQNVENLSLNDWFSAQRVKISELKSA
jgi:hypothetical protein